MDQSTFVQETGLDRDDVYLAEAFAAFTASGESFADWWAENQAHYL